MRKDMVAAVLLVASSSLVLGGEIKTSVQKDLQKEEKKEMQKEQKKAGLSSDQIKALQTITLKVEEKNGDLHFSWTPATAKDSGGVKIAYSATNPEPVYPFDSYIAWLPGSGLSSHVVKNAQACAKEARYYRICAVKPDNHSAYSALSNVIKVSPVNASAATQEHLKQKQEAKQKEHELKKVTPKPEASPFSEFLDDTAAPKKVSQDSSKDTSPSANVFCTKCGAKCGADDNYCSKCGQKLK